jgi:hypothetical protein
MANNVGSALDHLRFLNGKEIEAYTKGHVSVNHVVSRKIFAKFVHLTLSLGYLCK